MTAIIHRASDRAFYNHGWLKTYHSFSFAQFHDSNKMSFGKLRVLNDDILEPKMGFGLHPHHNMEIVSIPLSGAIRHFDSENNEKIIKAGDVQIMSAGTGIYHAEYNASSSDTVNFLQLWFFPKKNNNKPFYRQMSFDSALRVNNFQFIVKPQESPNHLTILQDAYLSLISLEENVTIPYELHANGNGIYIFNIEGIASIQKEKIYKRDAIAITGEKTVDIRSQNKSELLVIEVPMN